MIIEIKVPSPGESISEVQLASWLVDDGDFVEKDKEIAEVDSDKATLSLIAQESGTIKILVHEGDTIKVGTLVATIDTAQGGKEQAKKKSLKEENPSLKSNITIIGKAIDYCGQDRFCESHKGRAGNEIRTTCIGRS